MNKILPLVVLAALVPFVAAAQTVSPYTGQEQRAIKSLSPDEVKAYLAGEGMGLAKAGELNHYPGPKHILAMADHLGLTPAQRARIEAAEKAMSATAIPLGRAIVDAEADLDARFAAGTIDERALRAATAHIAELEGRLRAAHLLAHIQTRAVLEPDQITMYDSMRGYDANGDPAKHMH
jgi:Spy/CpxP family protein refolding chaperone